MSDALPTDLVSELREACRSGKGNYGHRLLCGKAADEIELMRREAKALAKSAADAIDEKVRLQVAMKNRGWSET